MAGTECKEEVKSSSFLHLIHHVVILYLVWDMWWKYSVDIFCRQEHDSFLASLVFRTAASSYCTLRMLLWNSQDAFSAWLQGQDNSRRGWSLDKSHRPDSWWYFSPGQKLTVPGTAVFSCSRCTLLDLFQKTIAIAQCVSDELYLIACGWISRNNAVKMWTLVSGEVSCLKAFELHHHGYTGPHKWRLAVNKHVYLYACLFWPCPRPVCSCHGSMVRCLLFKCFWVFSPEAAVVVLCYNWTHAFSQQCQLKDLNT